MHPDQVKFLVYDRMAALTDEGRRNQLLASAPREVAWWRGRPVARRHRVLSQLVGRVLRVTRPILSPFRTGISQSVQRLGGTPHGPG